ncbi:hypothetical protein ADUPG1_011291, partial [Aduncisulcus paluster]
VQLSHLSIPFPSPSPMKGAYICVSKFNSSPSLLFTFTDCDGKEIFKKYEYTRPKHDYEWHFLPIDLDNVVLCEIEGKGTCKFGGHLFPLLEQIVCLLYVASFIKCTLRNILTGSIQLYSLYCAVWSCLVRFVRFVRFVFVSRTAPLEIRVVGYSQISLFCCSFTDAVIQTVKPEFIHKGYRWCGPISRDSRNIKSAELPSIKAIDESKEEDDEKYDQSSNAQKMMKGESNNGNFTHISIPFSSSFPMKGAYICLFIYSSPPSHIFFTLTSSKGEKTSKKYEFPEFESGNWYFLPVDLPDVLLCEITGKGRKKEWFGIDSLVFIRDETPEEITSREAREKLWSETPVVKPEFVKEGDKNSYGILNQDSIPIPRDDPKLVDPSFSMVKCKNDRYSKESEEYDQSLKAQRMLKGECGVRLSHLSIPFPSPSPMKGAYICVGKNTSSPSLLFTFTDCYGKKTS